MENIKKLINDMVDNGSIEKMVEEAVKDNIEKSIKSVFNGYSLQCDIQDAFKKQINPNVFDFSAYKDLVNKAMEKAVATVNCEKLQADLMEQVNLVINKGKSEYSLLEDIINEFVQYHKSESFNEYYEGKLDLDDLDLTVIIEYSDVCDGYYHVYLNDGAKSEKHYCSCKFAVTSKGEIYSLKIDGVDMEKGLPIKRYSDFENNLISAFINKAVINKDYDC